MRAPIELVAALVVRVIMREGKKAKAFFLFVRAHDYIKRLERIDVPILVWIVAIENVRPRVQLKKIKVAGRSLLIPVPIQEGKSWMRGLRLICSEAKLRKDLKGFSRKLAAEVVDAYQYRGRSIAFSKEYHIKAIAARANLRLLRRK